MAIDKKRRLWFNCQSPSVVLRYDTITGDIVDIREDKNKPIHLNKIAIKSEDQYWLMADNGLFVASNILSAKPEITSVSFFNDIAIYDLKTGKENIIWLDTSLGVYRGNETSGGWEFSAMASQLGEKEDSLFGNMMVDQQGWIWGRDGVLDTSALVFHRFRTKEAEDIGSSWLGGAIAIDKNTLIVAGDMQLAVYEPKKFSIENYIPNLIATGLAINNEKQTTIPSFIELNENKRSVAVDFSLVDFRRPGAHKYRYKLDGYDDAWNYTDGSNRKAVYANLPVGHYVLRVEGVVDGKEWGRSSIDIPIIRLPAYHETLWFKAIGLILILGFLWFLHKLNLRRKLRLLQKREVELNELVNLRTQELELSLNNLKLTQKKLVDSEKLALLGRLVRGLAHELNTPLSVVKMAESMLHNMLSEARQFIGEQSEGQASKFQQKSEKALHLINENLNRSINLIAHFKSVDVEDGENQASWFNVGIFLSQIASNVEAKVALRGDSNLEVLCHQGSLIKVIDELLKNAQLHGGDNIEIEYLVKTSAVTRKEELTIFVNDNNKGISDDVLEKMFQPFYSTHSGGGSPGLGLYMVENTVRFVMGGEVKVHSEEGKHTSFEIILPCDSRQNVKESA